MTKYNLNNRRLCKGHLLPICTLVAALSIVSVNEVEAGDYYSRDKSGRLQSHTSTNSTQNRTQFYDSRGRPSGYCTYNHTSRQTLCYDQ